MLGNVGNADSYPLFIFTFKTTRAVVVETEGFSIPQFKAVEQFSDLDKTVVEKLIDAFIEKKQLR